MASGDGTPGAALNGVVIGLLSSFGSAVLIALIFVVVWFFRYTNNGRILLDRIGRPGEYDDEQAFAREEAEALEVMDDLQRTEYLRAKAFIASNPAESVQTDISLSQYLAIQEKGVSAWEFEPELEIANCFVEARTEIEFFDSECTVMSNLPVPKQNEVYYWESKIYDKPDATLLSIGMVTKPYPLFRLPGYHKYSVAYLSSGVRRLNQPFTGTPYGPTLVQGDVIGCGYRPRTGTIFYTRNGKKLDDVVHGLKTQNFFPAVGANGPATVHVNFGQAGFVFIEANVKKWGLAPMTGSQAPPPPYGSEAGSILLEAGRKDGYSSSQPSGAAAAAGNSHSIQAYFASPLRHTRLQQSEQGHGRSRSGNLRITSPTSPGPVRSPTDISLAQLSPNEDEAEPSTSTSTATGAGNGITMHSAAGLGVVDRSTNQQQPPPPEYTSPEGSDSGSRRSSDSDNTPLIRAGRNRGVSSPAVISQSTRQSARRSPDGPPIPSYSDAVRMGAGRSRSSSVATEHEDHVD